MNHESNHEEDQLRHLEREAEQRQASENLRAERPRDVTPDDLRHAFKRRGLKADGVDFELLAAHQNDDARIVAGWSAPDIGKGWRVASRDDIGGAKYINPQRRLRAILSCHIESDGRAWLHLSVSHSGTPDKPSRLPTHGEMRVAKEEFLGDRTAISVLPPRAKYVNISEVLHMFALLDETASIGLPDFSGGTGSL